MISVYMVPGNIRPAAGDVLSLSLVLDPRMVEVYSLEARCEVDLANARLLATPDVNLALFAAESQVTIGASESEDAAWVVSIAQPADAMPVTRKDVAISGTMMVLGAGEVTVTCSVRAALSDGQLWDIPVAPLTLVVEERPVVGRIVGTVWRAWGSHAAQTGHAGIVISLFAAAAEVPDLDSPGALIATTQTLEDGSFALLDIPAGRYRIRASDDSNRATLAVERMVDLTDDQHVLLPPVVLPWGDINGDGQIDELDVVVMAGLYGSTVPPAAPNPADFDGDGRIGLLELSVLASNLRHSADSW